MRHNPRRPVAGLLAAVTALLLTACGDWLGPGVAAEVDGEQLEMAIQVDAAGDVEVIRPGDVMPPIETPTTDDARGVDPICTNSPACSLHDVTVAEALGRPHVPLEDVLPGA